MTKQKDHIDPLAQVLSDWSGLLVSEHARDADLIFGTSLLRLQNPAKSKERADRVRRAAAEIETGISTMSPGVERSTFNEAFRGALHLRPGEPDCVAVFIEALRAGAMALKEVAEADLAEQPHRKNENRINIEVAKCVAGIYVRITGKEPPAAGDGGPFQRLLHDVYKVLDRPNVDLRGPLHKVHEYRKNRHS